mmetsp:Transcript_785/g.2992  ORF Transcript_785/g.2992 Transcript_785/m.2992 type:complete len:256 (-) Transcript_785:35-802(-)
MPPHNTEPACGAVGDPDVEQASGRKHGRCLSTLRSAVLGSHFAGPLLYDKFRYVESLQLHPPCDRQEQARLAQLNYWEERTAKRLRWCMDPLVALGCAVAAIVLQIVTEVLWDVRLKVINNFLTEDLTAVNIALACVCGSCVALAFTLTAAAGVAWQPTAASSGIPGVIAFLNGVDWKGALTAGVLPVKIFGTALACAAGLAVGPEGPMIHIGTIIGMLSVNNIIRPVMGRLGGSSGAHFERELAREPLRYHIQA